METTCQASYPLNSENASPPGTFTVYLSWADMALPPKALRRAVGIAIVRTVLLFITSCSFARPSDRVQKETLARSQGIPPNEQHFSRDALKKTEFRPARTTRE